jgi:cytidine deaminase
MTDRNALVQAARAAREHALASYSHFQVGAAARAKSGRIFSGCNIENASYGLTLCAERVAVFKALSEGERGFDAVAVVTDSEVLTPPCGACRQILWEFCGDAEVILANLSGRIEIHRMSNLLPKPFDSSNF